MAFDRQGNLYVANYTNNTVHRFSPTGVDLGNFATTGMDHPEDLAFDTQGNLYVANYFANTVREFSPTGVDLGNFATTGLSSPNGLAFDLMGNLYVSNNHDVGDTTIHRFSATGTDLGDFATGVRSAGQLAFAPGVPEPAALTLTGLGLVTLLGYRWLCRRAEKRGCP
jgi:DNA-binding beta-propeller fold protein YncE